MHSALLPGLLRAFHLLLESLLLFSHVINYAWVGTTSALKMGALLYLLLVKVF